MDTQAEIALLESMWQLPGAGIYRSDNPDETYPWHVEPGSIVTPVKVSEP